MYDFKRIEKKWQDRWEKSKEFQAKENKKDKFYLLEMLPYPSGFGLHMGLSNRTLRFKSESG